MPREICRRRNHRHPHLRPDTRCDHVLGDLFAHPRAGVIAFRNDIGEAVVDNDLDIDVRMIRQEPLQGGLQDGNRRMLASRDPNRAGGLLAQLAQGGELRLDLLEPRRDGLQQALSCFGRRHAACRAGEETKPDPVLQGPDLAERRL
jgi:hypothetical protein